MNFNTYNEMQNYINCLANQSSHGFISKEEYVREADKCLLTWKEHVTWNGVGWEHNTVPNISEELL